MLSLVAVMLLLLGSLICWNVSALLNLTTVVEETVCAVSFGIVFIGLGFLIAYGAICAFKGTFSAS